jgi:SAM-dependent methyltransferase
VREVEPPPLEALPKGHSKADIRERYDGLNARMTRSGRRRTFINYGFIPEGDEGEARIDADSYLLNPKSARLVAELIGDTVMAGRVVLDVGCGRGGTVSLVDRHFDPRMVIGIDLSWEGVAYCRSRYRSPRMRFLEGDAERLPFDDGSIDVVTNVESSHCYPNIDEFYRGVARVLAPGGMFLYTDFLPTEAFDRALQTLGDAGLRIRADRDITGNVLRSLDEEGEKRTETLDDLRERGIEDFFGVPGSTPYSAMSSGRSAYRILRLEKAA